MNHRGYILLKDNYIYFANDGLPFDRNGAIAISKHNISSKGGNEEDIPIDLFKNIPDEEWIEAQHKHSINNYITEPNNIGSDRKREIDVSRDYQGRWLFEVLQNMDDAIGPKDFKKFIGTKGLGFLSILNIGHTPEIFSGKFNFKFSKKLTTEKLLNSENFKKEYEKHAQNPPMFQVFHSAIKDQNIENIFKQNYKTVIKLSISSDQKENIINDLKKIDYKFLIFSRNLKKLNINIDEFYKISFEKNYKNISKNNNFFKDELSIKINNHVLKNETLEQWILWGRQWKSNSENNKFSSCMMALPFDGKKCFPLKSHSNFYNFFPTKNNSKTFALFHITFQLSQDRNNLQMWGRESKWESKSCNRENIELLENLEKLVSENFINDSFVNPQLVLEVFQDLNDDQDVLDYLPENAIGEVNKKLKNELIYYICNASFIPIYGGGKSNPKSLNLWKSKLIYCFEPDKEISVFNLPFQNINELFDILTKYNCKYISTSKFINILFNANRRIANDTEREELLKIVSFYLKDINFIYFKKIFSIELFEDVRGNIVSLNEGPYFKNSIKKIPSFIHEKRLNTFSEKLISKYFLKDFTDDVFLNKLKEKYITNDNEIINSIPDIISSWYSHDFANNAVRNLWPENGYELLYYLIKYFIKNKKVNFEKELLDTLYLPTDKKDNWQNCKKIGLSKQWGASKGFVHWFESNENNDFFRIKSKKSFLNELKKREKKRDQFEIKSKEVKSFLLYCGVRDYPKLKIANYSKVQSSEIYLKYEKHPNSIRINYIDKEYYYENINEVFHGINFSETCLMSLNMIKEANNFKSVYWKPYARHSQPRNSKYKNLGLFQLANLKWFRYKPSIVCADGLYSPMEIVITSKVSNQILPIFTKKDLKVYAKINDEQLNFLIENLKIRTNSEKLSKDQILNFMIDNNSFESNFNKYLKDYGKDFAHGQLRELLKILSDLYPIDKKEHNYTINFELQNIFFPCYEINNLDEKITWFEKDKVLLNDTYFDIDQLKRLKFLNQFGIFFINQNNINFQTLSSIIDVDVNPKYIEESKLEIFKSLLKDKWSLINFIQKYLENPVKATFDEFKDRFLFCSNIKLSISYKEIKEVIEVDLWKEDDKFFINLDLNEDVDEDIDKDLQLFYMNICKLLFRNGKSYALVKDILNCVTEYELRETFKVSDIDPLLFKDYQNLHYENDIFLRNKDFLNEKNQNQIIKTNLKNDKLNQEKRSEIELLKENIGQDNEKIKETKQSEIGKNSSKSNLNPPKKNNNKNNDTPSRSFGKRLSGHLRPVNPRGVIVRNFFDDEISSNKETGLEGERHVVSILEQQGYEGVNLLGGNNKGYDIEYIDGNQTHFVEVKSLKGFWEESDVLLSKAQFEKAQIEKDRYTICIVENLGSKKDMNVFSINNPVEYFTKLQIDHGWKDFAAQIDKIPEIGNFIEIKGEILEILKVTKLGKQNRYRLELSNKEFEFYKPDEMILKDKKDLD